MNPPNLYHQTPWDRVSNSLHEGYIYPAGEQARIVSAEQVRAPDHVAAALGRGASEQVIRRHRIVYRDGQPVSVSTSWYPGWLMSEAPLLLLLERLPQGTPAYITQATGRRLVGGLDQLAAVAADAQTAAELEVPEGSPVLVVRNTISDEAGKVVEFGESTVPAWRWLSYPYRL